MLEPLSEDDADSIVDQLLGGLDPRSAERILRPPKAIRCTSNRSPRCSSRPGRPPRRRPVGRDDVIGGAGHPADRRGARGGSPGRASASEERGVIDPASVIGLGFAVEAVVHLVPEDVMPEVPDRLGTLTAKQFVARPSAEADFYRFGHRSSRMPHIGACSSVTAPSSTNGSSTGPSRSTASAAASSSSRRSLATTSSRPTASESSSGLSTTPAVRWAGGRRPSCSRPDAGRSYEATRPRPRIRSSGRHSSCRSPRRRLPVPELGEFDDRARNIR